MRLALNNKADWKTLSTLLAPLRNESGTGNDAKTVTIDKYRE